MSTHPGQRPRLSRRAWLKLAALVGAAAVLPRPAGAQPAEAARLRVGSALPLPYDHIPLGSLDLLDGPALAEALRGLDLALVPAHAAAQLVAHGAVLPLAGTPGRAHDPDGAFCRPYTRAVTALVAAGSAPQSLEALWQAGAAWPAAPRLALGVALLRRGHSPNTAHPGHLAQALGDLAALRALGVDFAADPAARVWAGRARVGLVLLNLAQAAEVAPLGLAWAVPADGALLVEHDWVIPAGAAEPQAAREFMARQPAPRLARVHPGARLVPLAPLTGRALAQIREDSPAPI